MNVREAIQKMNEKILEIRLAAAEQRPLLNDEDKEKLDELVNKSIEVVKNAGNKIEATVNELAQDEKVDEFLQRVGDRCEEACNFTIDRIRSFGAEYAPKEPETEPPAEEEPAPAEEPKQEETPAVEEPVVETPAETIEETVDEAVEEAAETVEEIREEVAETVEEIKEEPEETVEEVKDATEDVVGEACECEDKKEECCCEKEEPCCCEEPKQEECCCKEEEPCCCEKPAEEEPKAEEPAAEEPVNREFKAEPEKENGEPSPIDVFLMSEDVQNVVKTVKDVTTNVRKGFDDYYNRPETREEIRKTKKAILDLAEKGMAALRKILEEDE